MTNETKFEEWWEENKQELYGCDSMRLCAHEGWAAATAAAQERIKELEGVLEFYADEKNYGIRQAITSGRLIEPLVLVDQGAKAREARKEGVSE